MRIDELMNYNNKWFVLHHKSLYNDNPNIIGFRDTKEWSRIKTGDLVVYYQSGTRRLRGVYCVVKSGITIDPTFGKSLFSENELKNQHKLNLIIALSAEFSQNDARTLSFHKTLKNPIRWDNKRVFPITSDDLIYLMLK